MTRRGARTKKSATKRAPAASRPTVDLSVSLGAVRLANPILVASGTFGYGDEYAHVCPPSLLGGVITKTVTVEPRAGNPPARIAEAAGGMLNSIGLENVGLERFRREKLPKLRSLGATIVASVGGETPDELVTLLEALGGEPGVAGFEINFSCPNVAKGGARYWADARRLEATMKRLRALTRAALIAKLSPDVTSVPELAAACEQGGADAITAVNTFVGMSLDLSRRRSRLGRASGGVSGPAIKPMALARCAETVAAVSIPVIGSGGIVSAQDALEFLAVGASAVQIGTVSFVRPAAAIEILRDLAAWLASEGYSKLEDFRGCMALERGACGTAAQGDESEKGAVRAPVEESRS